MNDQANLTEDSSTKRLFPAVLAIYLGLVALVWSVFGQTLSHPFIAYDDQSYVYENPTVLAGITTHGVVAAFAEPQARNWHPLTTLSHMLDCELFGVNAGGHHFTSVLLHTVATLLLFGLLRAMTGRIWTSAFVAAVFAIHPLRVESVAWVAERKDVLSGVFFMLTIGAYIRYTAKPSRWRYLAVASIFALGLMAKSMLVTLPLLLLLLDYWPLQRFKQHHKRQLIREKLPLLGVSLLAAIITAVVQRSTVSYTGQIPWPHRIENAVVSYAVYLGQMFWPTRLALFYPQHAISGAEFCICFALLLAVTFVAVRWRQDRPYLLVGWLWYLIALLPVIGLVQVGLQAHADRYTYLPQIGIYLAIAFGLTALPWREKIPSRIMPALAMCSVGVLGFFAAQQASYWRNTETLWAHAAEVVPDNSFAEYNLAAIALQRGRIEDAIRHDERALRGCAENDNIHSGLSPALIQANLGTALARAGRLEEAKSHLTKAIELEHDFADAHANLATILVQQGDLRGAIAHYEKAASIPPEDAPSHLVLANLLWRAGQEHDALAHYQRAHELDPSAVPEAKAFVERMERAAAHENR